MEFPYLPEWIKTDCLPLKPVKSALQPQIDHSARIQKNGFRCLDNSQHYIFTGGTAQDHTGSLCKRKQRSNFPAHTTMSTLRGRKGHFSAKDLNQETGNGICIQPESA